MRRLSLTLFFILFSWSAFSADKITSQYCDEQLEQLEKDLNNYIDNEGADLKQAQDFYYYASKSCRRAVYFGRSVDYFLARFNKVTIGDCTTIMEDIYQEMKTNNFSEMNRKITLKHIKDLCWNSIDYDDTLMELDDEINSYLRKEKIRSYMVP